MAGMKKYSQPAFIDERNMCLLTDLYQLSMGQVYLASGKNNTATFDLFVRKLPKERGYLVAAGLEQALYFLENIAFNGASIGFLRGLKMFSESYLEYLC